MTDRWPTGHQVLEDAGRPPVRPTFEAPLMIVFRRSHLALRFSLAPLVCFSALVACGSGSSDAAPGSSSSQASTSPVTCPAGAIHPRTCIQPISGLPDSGVDTTGDYALDVNNDVDAPCPKSDRLTGARAFRR
jgi:hypothetical protein